MPTENNKSSQPAAIPVICGQKISVDFGQRKAVITVIITKLAAAIKEYLKCQYPGVFPDAQGFCGDACRFMPAQV